MKIFNNFRKPKAILFTSESLDGCVCGFLASLVFEDLKIKYCTDDSIDDKINSFLKQEQYKQYTTIFITDLSVSKEMWNEIKSVNIIDKDTRLVLIDGNNTNKELSDQIYSVDISKAATKVTVDIGQANNNPNNPTSTADRFYKFLVKNYRLQESLWLENLVTKTKRTNADIFEVNYDDDISYELSILAYSYGGRILIDNLKEKYVQKSKLLNYKDNDVIAYEKIERQNYLKEKSEGIVLTKKENETIRIGVILAEQSMDHVSKYAADEHNYLDFIITFNFYRKTFLINAINITTEDIKDKFISESKPPRICRGRFIFGDLPKGAEANLIIELEKAIPKLVRDKDFQERVGRVSIDQIESNELRLVIDGLQPLFSMVLEKALNESNVLLEDIK